MKHIALACVLLLLIVAGCGSTIQHQRSEAPRTCVAHIDAHGDMSLDNCRYDR